MRCTRPVKSSQGDPARQDRAWKKTDAQTVALQFIQQQQAQPQSHFAKAPVQVAVLVLQPVRYPLIVVLGEDIVVQLPGIGGGDDLVVAHAGGDNRIQDGVVHTVRSGRGGGDVLGGHPALQPGVGFHDLHDLVQAAAAGAGGLCLDGQGAQTDHGGQG